MRIPAAKRSRVLLPAPLGPVNAQLVPLGREKETSTNTRPRPKVWETLANRSAGAVSSRAASPV